MITAIKVNLGLEVTPDDGSAESGFTKFRFQAMTQYPEKSDQSDARLDVTSQLSGIPLVRFFRILHHSLKPEFVEARL